MARQFDTLVRRAWRCREHWRVLGVLGVLVVGLMLLSGGPLLRGTKKAPRSDAPRMLDVSPLQPAPAHFTRGRPPAAPSVWVPAAPPQAPCGDTLVVRLGEAAGQALDWSALPLNRRLVADPDSRCTRRPGAPPRTVHVLTESCAGIDAVFAQPHMRPSQWYAANAAAALGADGDATAASVVCHEWAWNAGGKGAFATRPFASGPAKVGALPQSWLDLQQQPQQGGERSPADGPDGPDGSDGSDGPLGGVVIDMVEALMPCYTPPQSLEGVVTGNDPGLPPRSDRAQRVWRFTPAGRTAAGTWFATLAASVDAIVGNRQRGGGAVPVRVHRCAAPDQEFLFNQVMHMPFLSPAELVGVLVPGGGGGDAPAWMTSRSGAGASVPPRPTQRDTVLQRAGGDARLPPAFTAAAVDASTPAVLYEVVARDAVSWLKLARRMPYGAQWAPAPADLASQLRALEQRAMRVAPLMGQSSQPAQGPRAAAAQQAPLPRVGIVSPMFTFQPYLCHDTREPYTVCGLHLLRHEVERRIPPMLANRIEFVVALDERYVGFRQELEQAGIRVHMSEFVPSPPEYDVTRQYYTGLEVLRMTQYDVVVVLDSDVLPWREDFVAILYQHAAAGHTGFLAGSDAQQYKEDIFEFNTGAVVLTPSLALYDIAVGLLGKLYNEDNGDQGFVNELARYIKSLDLPVSPATAEAERQACHTGPGEEEEDPLFMLLKFNGFEHPKETYAAKLARHPFGPRCPFSIHYTNQKPWGCPQDLDRDCAPMDAFHDDRLHRAWWAALRQAVMGNSGLSAARRRSIARYCKVDAQL